MNFTNKGKPVLSLTPLNILRTPVVSLPEWFTLQLKNKKLSSSIFTFFSIIPLQYNYSFALLARDMPSTHTDAMSLHAEILEEAVHSNVASRVTSRINSIAPSLIASAIQSRRGSIKQSCSASRRGSLGPAAFMNLPPGK